MIWWTKTKNFVVKYWQWIVMLITAIAFYILGRSNDAKQQQVDFYKKYKDLEEKKSDEVVEGIKGAVEEKDTSTAENILRFEEKKHKILRDAKKINVEEYLKSKGIKEDK